MEERGIGVVVVGGQVKCLPLAPVVRVVLDTNERARAAGRGRANQRVENQSAISNCRQIFLSVLGGGGGNVDGDGQSFHRTTSVTESNLFFFSSISLSSRLPFAPHPTAEIECCRIGGGPRLRAAPCPSPLLSSRRAEPRLDRTPVSRVDHQSSQVSRSRRLEVRCRDSYLTRPHFATRLAIEMAKRGASMYGSMGSSHP